MPTIPSKQSAEVWAIDQSAIFKHHAEVQIGRMIATEIAAVGKSNIAIVRIQGPLSKSSGYYSIGTAVLRKEIRAAAVNPQINAILLVIDSPGGTVAGTSELAADIAEARKAKPVWAFIEDVGASAAYWLASQADLIYANSPTALIGSIGTIIVAYDYSKMAEKDGIKALVFATGDMKGAGVPGTEITADQQAYFQGIVDEAQKSFDAAVMRGRGMSAATLAKVRNGGVYPASKALEMRLIDGIQSLDSTLSKLAKAK